MADHRFNFAGSFALILALFATPIYAEILSDITPVISISQYADHARKDQVHALTPSKGFTAPNLASFRLIAEGKSDSGFAFNLHYLLESLCNHDPLRSIAATNIFRLKPLRDSFIENKNCLVQHQLDQANVAMDFQKVRVLGGRRAINWGSGRFWQPTNIFGAFRPTTLDREYKPGIDMLSLQYFPSSFTSYEVTTVISSLDHLKDNSGAVRLQSQLRERDNISLVLASIRQNLALGVSYETDWHGAGFRSELLGFENEPENRTDYFWIAGIDYQFANEIILISEVYYNSAGSNNRSNLVTISNNALFTSGLQQHLSDKLLAISIQKTLNALITGTYTLFTSVLQQPDIAISTLHQASLSYSLSNESDLLFVLLFGTGKGLNSLDEPQSEFGHYPLSLNLRYRIYL